MSFVNKDHLIQSIHQVPNGQFRLEINRQAIQECASSIFSVLRCQQGALVNRQSHMVPRNALVLTPETPQTAALDVRLGN